MPSKILVVDDEISLRETLAYNLEHHGYVVDTVSDGEKALPAARRFRPDLVILDIMLPGADGFEVCRLLRQEMNMPILFLSARDDEFDRIIGLEIGGDDFITKPFSMRELVARVKAQFRTMQLVRDGLSAADGKRQNECTATFGNLTINYQRHEVRIGQTLLVLKPKEYDLLAFFTENRSKVFSRDAIIKAVWGWEFQGDSRTIDVHVRWLREKIEIDPYHPTRLVTVHGIGYRFEG